MSEHSFSLIKKFPTFLPLDVDKLDYPENIYGYESDSIIENVFDYQIIQFNGTMQNLLPLTGTGDIKFFTRDNTWNGTWFDGKFINGKFSISFRTKTGLESIDREERKFTGIVENGEIKEGKGYLLFNCYNDMKWFNGEWKNFKPYTGNGENCLFKGFWNNGSVYNGIEVLPNGKTIEWRNGKSILSHSIQEHHTCDEKCKKFINLYFSEKEKRREPICLICSEIIAYPVSIDLLQSEKCKCEQLFCLHCVRDMLGLNKRTEYETTRHMKCLLCRENFCINKNDITTRKIKASLIYTKYECIARKLDEKYGTIDCPRNCGKTKLLRTELDNHYKTCSFNQNKFV